MYGMKGLMFGTAVSALMLFFIIMFKQLMETEVFAPFGATFVYLAAAIPFALLFVAEGFRNIWPYIAVIAPFALFFTLVGHYLKKKGEMTETAVWTFSGGGAFGILFYSGMFMPAMIEVIFTDKIQRIDIIEILRWGFVYSIILLPLSIFIIRALVKFFIRRCLDEK